jgi:hypothetical protein
MEPVKNKKVCPTFKLWQHSLNILMEVFLLFFMNTSNENLETPSLFNSIEVGLSILKSWSHTANEKYNEIYYS